MTEPTRLPVVVPAIPPKPPQITLLGSAVRPDEETDPPLNQKLGKIPADVLAGLPADLRAELQAREGDAWVRGITYAPENHWATELIDPCNETYVDLPVLEAPRELKLAEVAGGTIPAEELEYQVTAVNANGETTALPAVIIVNKKEGSIKLTWAKVSLDEPVTYRVYGRAKGSKKLIATVGPFSESQTAEFVDNGSKAPGAAKPPVSNTTGGKGSYTNLATVTAIPYGMVAEDYCSTFGFEARDFKGRASRLLENGQYKATEKEFWTGALSKSAGLGNLYLAKHGLATDLTEGKPPSAERGFEMVQKALAECGFGGQGMIHVQVDAAPSLLRVRRVGLMLYDMFDNIVVPGVGYPGTGPENAEGIPKSPEAGNAYIFASDLVAARVEKDPTISTQTFAEATDWGQGMDPNSIRMRARKFAIAYADFACAFALEVKLPT